LTPSRGQPLAGPPCRLSRLHVEAVAGAHEEEAPARAGDGLVAVDHGVALPDHVELIALHDDRRVLVEADAEQPRMRIDDLEHVELAVAAQQVTRRRRRRTKRR
jgi:hypothetical protein